MRLRLILIRIGRDSRPTADHNCATTVLLDPLMATALKMRLLWVVLLLTQPVALDVFGL